eukprot:scaffold1380_cov290-Chaetoceros_neogracile.AAC.2
MKLHEASLVLLIFPSFLLGENYYAFASPTTNAVRGGGGKKATTRRLSSKQTEVPSEAAKSAKLAKSAKSVKSMKSIKSAKSAKSVKSTDAPTDAPTDACTSAPTVSPSKAPTVSPSEATTPMATGTPGSAKTKTFNRPAPPAVAAVPNERSFIIGTLSIIIMQTNDAIPIYDINNSRCHCIIAGGGGAAGVGILRLSHYDLAASSHNHAEAIISSNTSS